MQNYFADGNAIALNKSVHPKPLSSAILSEHLQFVMRASVCLVVILSWCLQLLFANEAIAQRLDDTYINLEIRNLPLVTALQKVEQASGFKMAYPADIVGSYQNVSLSGDRQSVAAALTALLANTGLRFRQVKGNVILFKPQPQTLKTLATGSLPKRNLLFQQPISGRIVARTGQPLAGASVRYKSNKNSVRVSDQNGYFRLPPPHPFDPEILQVSYIGYQTQELEVNANTQSPLTIVMQEEEGLLDEVVVNTGFQTLNKERATGSFGLIDSAQLDKPTINIAQRLIGTTAGMQATLDADGNPRFEIRGQTSLNIRDDDGAFTPNAYPLVVVDGFPIQGDFNSINPNDVESVTVLKDAAAASIWGARAGNGVIVVTTKRAKKGSPLRVDFQAFSRIGSKVDLDYVRPLASSYETVEYEKRAFNKWSALENSGALQTNYGKQWSLATVALSEHHLGYISEAQRDAELARLQALDNRQQIKDLLLSNPVNQQYNLTLSGASERMSNYASLLYEHNQSNFKETKGERYMLNYRTTANLLKWLDFNASAMFQYTDDARNGVDLADIQGLSPYDMLQNPDGTLTNIHQYYWPIMERFVPMDLFPYADWTYNPIQEIHNRDLTTKSLNTRLMGGLTIKPLKGLSFDSKIQYELFNTFNRNLYNENTFYVRSRVNQSSSWNMNDNTIVLNLPKGSIIEQDFNDEHNWNRIESRNWNFRNQVSFDRFFSDQHELHAIAGSEINNYVTEQFYNPPSYGYNEETLSTGTFPNGPGGTFYPIQNWLGSNQTFRYTNSFTYRTERYFSVFGNAAYTYLNKYTLSGSVRTDASNMITDDPSYRYSPFWSLGGRWQADREKFLEDVSWLNQLSVRLTYGYNGNVDRSTSFRPLIAMSAIPDSYTNNLTANISSYGNPALRWERIGTWNLGIDYALWNGKLYGKIDLYHKYGKDLIAELSIPAVNGTTSQKLNNAAMLNRGVELELGTTLPIKGNDIQWRGNLNFSYNQNEITKLFVANYAASSLYSGGSAAYVEGYDANSMWMFEYAGVHNTQPMIYGADGDLYDFGAWTPGDGRDFMLNMGTKVAPYTLGFMNSFKFYDVDFSFIVTGKLGHVFRTLPFNYPPTWGSRVLPNNKLTDVMYGDPDKIVPLPQNDIEPRYYFWDRFHQYLSYLSANASHIRMQEVNLTYRVPLNRWNIPGNSRVLLYAQGNDLFTVLFNDAGEDPEYALGTLNPRPKFTFGLKVGF